MLPTRSLHPVAHTAHAANSHKGLDGHQLDQNVQGRAGGVLQGVADGVTNNGGLVAVAALAAQLTGVGGVASLQA